MMVIDRTVETRDGRVLAVQEGGDPAGVPVLTHNYGVDGLDYFEGVCELNAEDIQLYFRDKVAARAKAEADRVEMLGASQDDQAEIITSLLSGPDAAVLTGELAEYLDRLHAGGPCSGR